MTTRELPLEVWTLIFRYLPNAALARCARVTRQLTDAAIRQSWRHAHWQLDNSEKILQAVIGLEKHHKRPTIIELAVGLALPGLTADPLSHGPSIEHLARVTLALDKLHSMGLRVKRMIAPLWALQIPIVTRKYCPRLLREPTRLLFKALGRLMGPETALALSDVYYEKAEYEHVAFWESHIIPCDLTLAVIKFESVLGTTHNPIPNDFLTAFDADSWFWIPRIRVLSLNFASVKMNLEDWDKIHLPKTTKTVILHEEDAYVDHLFPVAGVEIYYTSPTGTFVKWPKQR